MIGIEEKRDNKVRPLSFPGRILTRVRSVLGRENGISAVEFALLSPILVLGSFATVDAGMAVYEEMMISNTLRSGAHLAISADSEAQILSVLQAVAAENFTVASDTPAAGERNLCRRVCAAFSNPGARQLCNGRCRDGCLRRDDDFQYVALWCSSRNFR